MVRKIVQIIPAPKDLYVIYRDAEEDIKSRVVCLGLTNEGEVLLMDVRSDGDIDEAMTACNFTGIHWG